MTEKEKFFPTFKPNAMELVEIIKTLKNGIRNRKRGLNLIGDVLLYPFSFNNNAVNLQVCRFF